MKVNCFIYHHMLTILLFYLGTYIGFYLRYASHLSKLFYISMEYQNEHCR